MLIEINQANPDWIGMLKGAEQSIRSSNPDKIRHSITSLRELLGHVLRHLSPDEAVKAWSASADDFHEGRPTRRGRLRYINRNIDHGPFSDFVEKDIKAVLAAFDLFQPGTHKVKPAYSDEQVMAIIARIEGAILFLLRVGNPDIDV